MITRIKKLGILLLVTGLTLSLSSCFITSTSTPTQQKKSTTIEPSKHKKPHPHGGPPGQTKKSKGHPGKKH